MPFPIDNIAAAGMEGGRAASALDAVRDAYRAFTLSTGRRPVRLKMGHDFVLAVADESYESRGGKDRRGITRDEWRTLTLAAARNGELSLFGILVEYQPPNPRLDVAVAHG